MRHNMNETYPSYTIIITGRFSCPFLDSRLRYRLLVRRISVTKRPLS